MDARQIRGWLLCQPRPAIVRVTNAEQQQHEIECSTSWAKLSDTVNALQPVLIEALDSNGRLLRACRPQEQDEPEEPGAGSPAAGRRGLEKSELVVFAQLLAEAYRHANEVAFGRMVDVFDATNRRAESLEKSLASMERLLRKQLEDQLENAGEASTNPLEQLVGAFVGGASAGASAGASSTPAPAPSNGKGKH